MKAELKKEYIPGSQTWFPAGNFWGRDNNLRGFGCGVVACMDFCVYKGEFEPASGREDYCDRVRAMAGAFFPIMPGLGIAPYYYTVLLNLFFVRKHFPYRVRRSFSAKNLQKVQKLLMQDYPVIICVGPTIPFFFKNQRIRLFRRREEGNGSVCFVPAGYSVSSHYMTVIGMESDAEGEIFFKTATWGEICYMKQADYLDYTKYTFPWTNRFYEIR